LGKEPPDGAIRQQVIGLLGREQAHRSYPEEEVKVVQPDLKCDPKCLEFGKCAVQVGDADFRVGLELRRLDAEGDLHIGMFSTCSQQPNHGE
jgi:hypothetical protein